MQLQMHKRKREGSVGFANAGICLKVAPHVTLTGQQAKSAPRREESKLMGKYYCSMNAAGVADVSRNVLIEPLCCTSQKSGTKYPRELIPRATFFQEAVT